MPPHTTVSLMKLLRGHPATTWFGINLFLDEIQKKWQTSPRSYDGSFRSFLQAHRRIGFVTFDYKVDGVTVEIEKYAAALRRIVPGIDLHYIGGKFDRNIAHRLAPAARRKQIRQLQGFESWPLYERLYYQKLSRGSKAYRQLAADLWQDTLAIVANLAAYIEKNKIQLLIPVNICSNPGNVSAALALVIVSEYMHLPMIVNAHDYYWEGGSSPAQRKAGAPQGPRDHFFSNSGLPEVFGLTERLSPWDSARCVYMNIHRLQSQHLVRHRGIAPALVKEVATTMDYQPSPRFAQERRARTWGQLEKLFGRAGRRQVFSVDARAYKHRTSTMPHQPVVFGLDGSAHVPMTTYNILLLQPTRILERKRIEIDLQLLEKMLQHKEFVRALRSQPAGNLILIVSGPIADGHENYYQELVQRFAQLRSAVPSDLVARVYLGFLFGVLPAPDAHASRVHIYDLYQTAALVLLPSLTEGRGLPIIESAALGVPMVAHQYQPAQVYADVVGKHLPARDQLRVIEFRGDVLPPAVVRHAVRHIMHPTNYARDIIHNRRAVQRRYSMTALQKDWRTALRALYNQMRKA